MPYTPTTWVDGVTPLGATQFNNIEVGLDNVTEDVEKRVGALARTSAVSLDTVVENGWYTIPAGTTNAPIAQKGYLKVEKPNDSWVRQIFYQYDVATPGPNYVRVYNPTPGTWTAWAPAVAGADLSFDGDWVAGTYQDGDTVVKDGVVFICVGGPTAVAPDASLWGSVGGGIPPLSEGRWLRVQGGAMLWGNPAAYSTANVTAANTDIPHPDAGAVVATHRITTGGGSIRAIGAATVDGSRIEIQMNGGAAVGVTLLHNTAGGSGLPLYIDGVFANVVLSPGYVATFTLINSIGLWVLTGITRSGPPMIAGRVNTAGAIAGGSGFTALRNSAGDYSIGFTPALLNTPVITLNPLGANNLIMPKYTTNPTSSGFRVVFNISGSGPVDVDWQFLAVVG